MANEMGMVSLTQVATPFYWLSSCNTSQGKIWGGGGGGGGGEALKNVVCG